MAVAARMREIEQQEALAGDEDEDFTEEELAELDAIIERNNFVPVEFKPNGDILSINGHRVK